MPLSIDPERCQGHGRCALISPKLFDVDDVGLGVVLLPDPGSEDAADVSDSAETGSQASPDTDSQASPDTEL